MRTPCYPRPRKEFICRGVRTPYAPLRPAWLSGNRMVERDQCAVHAAEARGVLPPVLPRRFVWPDNALPWRRGERVAAGVPDRIRPTRPARVRRRAARRRRDRYSPRRVRVSGRPADEGVQARGAYRGSWRSGCGSGTAQTAKRRAPTPADRVRRRSPRRSPRDTRPAGRRAARRGP